MTPAQIFKVIIFYLHLSEMVDGDSDRYDRRWCWWSIMTLTEAIWQSPKTPRHADGGGTCAGCR